MNLVRHCFKKLFQLYKKTKALYLGVLLSCPAVALSTSYFSEGITYQGRILTSTGTPYEAASTTFNIQILSPGTEGCILYEETQTISLAGSNGYFSFTIGKGTRSQNDPNLKFSRLFQNSTLMSGLTCSSGSAYTPQMSDRRNIRVQFLDSANDWISFNSDYSINPVPQAQVAEMLQDKGPLDFIQVNIASNVTQSSLETVFASFSELQALLNGTSALYSRSNYVGSQSVSTTTPTSGQVLAFNSTTNKWEPTNPSVASVNASLGSVAAPSMAFSGDVDTGIWSPGANSMALSTGGSERLRVDSSGNIGIGPTSPQNPLDIQANSGGNGLNVIANSAGASIINLTTERGAAWADSNSHIWGLLALANNNSDSTRQNDFAITYYNGSTQITPFSIKSANGNVGIGTTSPQVTLDVNGATWHRGAVALAQSNTQEIRWQPAGGSTVGWRAISGINGTTDGNLTFQHTNDAFSSNFVNALTLLPSGNIGIGTSAPTTTMDIFKSPPTGTITSTGPNVTGTGTNFTSSFSVGDVIISGGQAKTISTINSDTSLTTTTAFSPDISGNFYRLGVSLNSGNVRIGNSSGRAKLTVSSATENGGTTPNAPEEIFNLERAGVPGVNNNNIAEFLLSRYEHNGTDSRTQLDLKLRHGNLDYADAMTWRSNGYVGIGTTTPSRNLHVAGAPGLSAKIAISADTTGNAGAIDFIDSGSNKFWQIVRRATDHATEADRFEIHYTPNGTNFHRYLSFYPNEVADGSGGNANFGGILTIDGNVGIGLTNPAYKLDVTGDINASGCVRAGGSTLGGTCSSDERLKSEIQPFDLGLKALLGISPKTFKYNGLGEHPISTETEIGVIAQEVETTAPEIIVSRNVKLHPEDDQQTEIKQVNYSAFTYIVINAVKELYHQWSRDSEAIHRELASVKAENAQLKARLEAIEKNLKTK